MHNDAAHQRPTVPLARPDIHAADCAATSSSDPTRQTPAADAKGSLGARPVALGEAEATRQRPACEDRGAGAGLPSAQLLETLALQELARLRSRTRDPDAKGSAPGQSAAEVGLVSGSLKEIRCMDGQVAWQAQWRFAPGEAAQRALVFLDELPPASPKALKRAGVQEPPGGWHRHEWAARRLNQLLGLDVVARGQAGRVYDGWGWVQCERPGMSPIARGVVQMPLPQALADAICARPQLAREVLREQRHAGTCLDSDHVLTLKRDPVEVEPLEADLPTDAILVPLDYDDPVLRRGLNTLQWFDALIGHPGRKASDYVACLDAAGRVQAVVARRNAVAFGSHAWDRSAPPQLPRVIDRAVARALLEVDVKAIRGELADQVPAQALAALLERLEAIQLHISRIAERHHFGKASGLLEGDAQWASPGAGLLLGVPGPDAFKELGHFKAEAEDELMPAQGRERTDEVRATLAGRRKQAAALGYVAREAETQAQVLWWSAGPLRAKVPRSIPVVADPRPLAVALGVALDGAERPDRGDAGDRKENKGASPRASED